MIRMQVCLFAVGCFVLQYTGMVFAQQIVIQQPVIEQFGAATTIVVPDRGSAFVAGVGRAADASVGFGPFYRGSSMGRDVSHGSIETSVYIHDFEEMDRQLLNQAEVENPSYKFGSTSSSSAYYAARKNRYTGPQKGSQPVKSAKAPAPVNHSNYSGDDVFSLDQLRQDLKNK